MIKVDNLVTKDTVVAKVEVYAQGCYSGSEAYGEIYMPMEIYEANDTLINQIEIAVYELDGKHSEIIANAETIINTLENFLLNTEIKENYSDKYEENLTESLLYKLNFMEEGDILTTKRLTHEIINLAKEIDINSVEPMSEPVIVKEGLLFTI